MSADSRTENIDAARRLKELAELHEEHGGNLPPHVRQSLNVGGAILAILSVPAVADFVHGIEADALARFMTLVGSLLHGHAPAPADPNAQPGA